MEDSVRVKVRDEVVGDLVEENGEFIYHYNTKDQSNFISLTMQVRAKDYINKQLHPLFEMHLPEGYLLSIIKKHFSKIVKVDDFSLLRLMSPSIKGRVSYANNQVIKEEPLTLDSLLHSNDKNLFDELVAKFALSSALSGVQPKVLARIQDKATLSLDEYIVKSWGEDYPHLGLNEYYCMKIVKKAGITVPEFYLSDDNKLYIMKRFDIKDDGSYLGFEDMCVLQAKQRDDKYEGSYEGIVKTIKTFVSPKHKKHALKEFFKMVVINNFVQNGDAHLKNFGLIYRDITDIKLSPAYDVVSTTMYIENDIPALHLLGSKRWWDKKFLIQFGMEYCDLTKSEVNSLYEECLRALKEVLDEVVLRKESEKEREVVQFLSRLSEVFKRYL